jgi:hypothetical protein
MSKITVGKYVRGTAPGMWFNGLEGEVIKTGEGDLYSNLVKFPRYTGMEGHAGGQVAYTHEDGHKHYWVHNTQIEPLQFQVGDRVRVTSLDRFSGKEGTITRNDFAGEGGLPWWVKIDGETSFGGQGDRPYDAAELVKVEPPAVVASPIFWAAKDMFLEAPLFTIEDDGVKAFEEHFLSIDKTFGEQAAEAAFAKADADAFESDEFVVFSEDEDYPYVSRFDNLEDAIDEADMTVRDLHDETYVVYKKVYAVSSTRPITLPSTISAKVYK